jgi:c(7)-type cytochrome triheme protein
MRALKAYIDQKKEVPWVRIYRLPDHVYFSHRRHVGAGKLRCQTCHGQVQQFTEPAPRPVVEPTMDNCIDCHRQKKASVDCNACHR